jgi:hypothetical protein
MDTIETPLMHTNRKKGRTGCWISSPPECLKIQGDNSRFVTTRSSGTIRCRLPDSHSGIFHNRIASQGALSTAYWCCTRHPLFVILR